MDIEQFFHFSRFAKDRILPSKILSFPESPELISILRITVLALILIATFFCKLQAQSGIELELNYGRILNIHPDFPEIKSNSKRLAINYVNYTQCLNKAWPSLYRYPVLTISLSTEFFGNKEILGESIALTPSLSFPIIRKPIWAFYFQWGMGIAWLTKPYHQVTNPENEIIGSHLNYHGLAKLYLDWKISELIKLTAGIAYSHYSNGNFANPNIGANMPALSLSIRYFPNTWVRDNVESPKYAELPAGDRRFHAHVRSSLGLTTKGLDGPTLPVYTLSAGMHRIFGRTHKVLTGFEIIIDRSAIAFLQNAGGHEGKEFRKTSRVAWYLGHEFLIGHVGFLTEAGIYLNDYFLKRTFLSTKLGFTIYGRNPLRQYQFLPYLGIYIHALAGEAEFAEFAIGFDF